MSRMFRTLVFAITLISILILAFLSVGSTLAAPAAAPPRDAVQAVNPTLIVLIVALLGALARTLVPYLQILQEKPDIPFDRKFIIPPLVACVIAILTLPLALSALPPELIEMPTLSVPGLAAVFLAIWGATDVVRSGQKFIGALSKRSQEHT